MKRNILLFVFCIIGNNLFAQNSTPALDWGGQGSVNYWNENRVVINVEGVNLTYFMYNSREDRVQIASIVFDWYKKNNSGYIIDYSLVHTYYPNDDLSQNVRRAMTQRNCDISFTFYENEPGIMCLVINVLSNSRYYTTAYYF